jgi:hypothetical protein
MLQYICAQHLIITNKKDSTACKTHMFENLVSGVEDPSTPSAFGHVFLSLYTICIPALFLLSILDIEFFPPSLFFLFTS